jgi:hypothetical protein
MLSVLAYGSTYSPFFCCEGDDGIGGTGTSYDGGLELWWRGDTAAYEAPGAPYLMAAAPLVASPMKPSMVGSGAGFGNWGGTLGTDCWGGY